VAWNFKKNSGWKSVPRSGNWASGANTTGWKNMPSSRNWADHGDLESAPHFKKSTAGHWIEREDGVWEFEATDADWFYDEGDITTSRYDPVFRVHPTGPTDRDIHDPCGYWYKDLCLSSTLFPVEIEDEAQTVNVEIIEGSFRIGIHYYTGEPEDAETKAHEVISGIFRTTLHQYGYQEDAETVSHEVLSGVYRQALHSYDIGNEDAETKGHTVVSGVYRAALIQYENWPVESLETKGAAVIGGTYGS
jgi:hypothetical protein